MKFTNIVDAESKKKAKKIKNQKNCPENKSYFQLINLDC